MPVRTSAPDAHSRWPSASPTARLRAALSEWHGLVGMVPPTSCATRESTSLVPEASPGVAGFQ
eukprot:8221295-Lingulodinium_polyedra.AAC.2